MSMRMDRTKLTPKRREIFLQMVAAGLTVDRAAKAIGVSRPTVYEWRRNDESFRRDWEAAVDISTDAVEAGLFEAAKAGDTTAGIFLLRSRKPEVYNPNLVVRQAMLKLALEKAKAEAGGDVPMIEGNVEAAKAANLEPIRVLLMPFNFRDASPHLPADFDIGDWRKHHGPDEPLPFVPFGQDGSGNRMKLPRHILGEMHSEIDLPVSVVADGVRVPPEAATDLYRRVCVFNKGVGLMMNALDPGWSERRTVRSYARPSEALPSDSSSHDEDDERPANIEDAEQPPPFDHLGGFGRP